MKKNRVPLARDAVLPWFLRQGLDGLFDLFRLLFQFLDFLLLSLNAHLQPFQRCLQAFLGRTRLPTCHVRFLLMMSDGMSLVVKRTSGHWVLSSLAFAIAFGFGLSPRDFPTSTSPTSGLSLDTIVRKCSCWTFA